MIHDKDYILRIVKQFSEMLSKLILNKNEADLPEFERTFDTNMTDTFKMSFDDLAKKSAEDITALIDAKESNHHIPYFELLGHLFYVKGKELKDGDLLQKSKIFYETYLQRSGIFSLPVISRINELKQA